GRPALTGTPLVALVLAWLLGRLAMTLGAWLPTPAMVTLDMLFPLLLCLLVGREVFGGGSRRNYPVVAVLLALALLNLAYHTVEPRVALYLLVHTILLLITLIAGRIVPSFTANWLRSRGEQRLPSSSVLIDGITFALTAAVGVLASIAPSNLLTAIAAFSAAIVHAVRLARWRGLATRSEPLLFVLHAAYLWLPVGYALLGCAAVDWVFPYSVAMHALMMGAVAGMIIAVSTRVALGHTGRALHAARPTVAAYVIFTLAVLLRVLSAFGGSAYAMLIDLAATGWIISFAILMWVYAPMLIRARLEQT
ncbi:MAG: NnrS family protein, partial [Gammaproteobacteria bacterium]|nr:NnrS family protein [Gammaproteobacteria bacterium]